MDEDELLDKRDVADDFNEYRELAQGDVMLKISDYCQIIAVFYNKIFEKFTNITKNLDTKLSEKTGFCSNKFKISATFLYVFFFFILTMVVYIGLTDNAKTKTEPDGYSTIKQYAAKNLVWGALIFTFYGIIFLHLNSSVLYICLFLFQAMPSLYVFVYQCYSYYVLKNVNYPMNSFYESLLSFSIYFFWLATYLISEDLRRFFSNGIRNLFLSIWCVLFAAIIIGYTAYSIIITY